jgi:hypothetical protein
MSIDGVTLNHVLIRGYSSSTPWTSLSMRKCGSFIRHFPNGYFFVSFTLLLYYLTSLSCVGVAQITGSDGIRRRWEGVLIRALNCVFFDVEEFGSQ